MSQISIQVPRNLTIEESIQYVKEHLIEIATQIAIKSSEPDKTNGQVTIFEKDIPKRVLRKPWMITKCPTCSKELGKHISDGYCEEWNTLKRCFECGQLLDWGHYDEDEEDNNEE